MSDKELADKVVALGVGQEYPGIDNLYGIPALFPALQAKEFVRDWRVAGSLTEKLTDREYSIQVTYRYCHVFDLNAVVTTSEGKPPRTIIEACVEALGESDE